MYMSIVPENKTHRHIAHQRERKEDRKKSLPLVGIRVVISLYLMDTFITKHR